jgi:Protein of unknown function (DUF3253)
MDDRVAFHGFTAAKMTTDGVSIEDIRESILTRCAARAPNATICPSEVARELWPDAWRAHMNDVRNVGLALAREGKIDVTQSGERRDPNDEIRGAIRYRLTRNL